MDHLMEGTGSSPRPPARHLCSLDQLSAPAGQAVNLARHVEPGTGLHQTLAYGVAAFALLAFIASTMGVGLIALAVAPIADWLLRRRTMARLRGSALQVTERQMPQVYASARAIAARLGLSSVPDLFIVESNVLNAAAARVGRRRVVLLVDDAIDACLMTGNLAGLNFLIAHELAHHALGHTGVVRAYLAMVYRQLSRLDEFSADAVAAEIVDDPSAVASALTTLLTGPQLLAYVNREALFMQAAEVERDSYSKKSESALTHPLLLRRIARFSR